MTQKHDQCPPLTHQMTCLGNLLTRILALARDFQNALPLLQARYANHLNSIDHLAATKQPKSRRDRGLMIMHENAGQTAPPLQPHETPVSLGLLQWRSSIHLCSLGFSTAIIFCMTTATKILLECRYGPQTAGMPTARWCANMAILLSMMKGISKFMLKLVVFSSWRFQSPRCHLCLG